MVCGGDGLIEDGLLGGGAAYGGFAEGGGAEADVSDDVFFDQGEAGESDLGDGLGVAGADFADVTVIAGVSAREADGVKKLVGGQDGFFVAEVEVAVRQGAVGYSPGAGGRGDEGNGGVVRQERGRGVGGGRAVDEVAAEGTAVLVGDGAGPGGGMDEEREIRGQDSRVADVGEGGAGADGDVGGSGGDGSEARGGG